jgi:pimeloyl-ACP methyl ester carboxylesterase
MKTVHANGIDFAVADEGAGRPVVLVHGFPLDHSIWDGLVAPLARHWRVIAPDLRGFGASGVTPGTVGIPQHADDLAALLDALAVAEPVTLVGLSMGGYVAFEFFSRHRRRLRALVLCDTRAAADTPEAAAARCAAADRIQREGSRVLVELMLPRMLAAATFRDRPEVVARLEQIILGGNPAGQAAAARGLAQRADFQMLLPRIDCPTQLIVGGEDAISPPDEMAAMAAAIPAAGLVRIAAAGHMAPLEQPREIARAIEEFRGALGGRQGS